MSLSFIQNSSTDPAYNLALEEYLLVNRDEEFFLLWRNEPTVVIGRNQNTSAEINRELIKRESIHVVRRISGGGAVFHDHGNLNFSFLINAERSEFDYTTFTRPLLKTLNRLGIHAENAGRNDVAIDGKKISGNAQHKHQERLLHHGTILFSVDLDKLASVLKSSPEKYESKAIPSIRSRVCNVRDHLVKKIGVYEFEMQLLDEVCREYSITPGLLSENELKTIYRLRDEKYRNWAWTYGKSPTFWTHGGKKRFEWGTVEVRIEVCRGLIQTAKLYGDFFNDADTEPLMCKILGQRFDRETLEKLLDEIEIQRVLPEISQKQFFDIVFQEE